MRISDWSSDVCSSDLQPEVNLAEKLVHHPARDLREPVVPACEQREHGTQRKHIVEVRHHIIGVVHDGIDAAIGEHHAGHAARSEEHTSELQSLMRISYAVFCLKKKNKT